MAHLARTGHLFGLHARHPVRRAHSAHLGASLANLQPTASQGFRLELDVLFPARFTKANPRKEGV